MNMNMKKNVLYLKLLFFNSVSHCIIYTPKASVVFTKTFITENLMEPNFIRVPIIISFLLKYTVHPLCLFCTHFSEIRTKKAHLQKQGTYTKKDTKKV